MVMVMDDNKEETAPPTSLMAAKKKELLSTAMQRTTEWVFSQEAPSDVTVHIGETSFSLHKFPLVSKCGYIKKLLAESVNDDLSVIKIPDIPGGAEAFELAAKFCYGINFEMSTSNIAMLRCAAEYLQMTEDYAVGNLVDRAEAYLSNVVLKSLAGAASVLHSCEDFLPIAEEVKLVNHCIDTIAYIASKDSELSSSAEAEYSTTGLKPSGVSHWWAEDLVVLRIDIFRRVLAAMMGMGFKQYALAPVLMLYAQNALRGLEIFGRGRKKIELEKEHEKRVILETIVSLLPREKNALSVSFFSMLLRAAIYLETTFACRLDLEKRMSMQLGQAVLDDLLIPTYSFTRDTLFDVDTVQRIMMNYIEYAMESNVFGNNADEGYISPSSSDMGKVSKLMENYLAEVASDRNLSVSKFINLAELIPENAKITEDGIYRSIDIYLKAHPALSDTERKKVCSVMDCQKLSREACAHAAQNERLPVQTVVQVLYHEQQRMKDGPNGHEQPALPAKVSEYSVDILPVPDDISRLRRENQDLKLELLKMKMRLKEIEKSSGRSATSSPLQITRPSADKPPLPRKSFINSVSKKLGKLSQFAATPLNSKARNKPSKDRRHSIS